MWFLYWDAEHYSEQVHYSGLLIVVLLECWKETKFKSSHTVLSRFHLNSLDWCDWIWPPSFIHSFHIFLQHLFKSTTTQRRSQLQHWYCVGVDTSKRYRQQWEKDLPKIPMWQVKWDSNLRPSGHKAPNLPLSHHAPHVGEAETVSYAD